MIIPLRKVIDFAMTKPSEVDKAYRDFFGFLPPDKLQTEWEDLFLEWLIFNYKQQGKTSFFVEYILKNPDGLDTKEINRLEQVVKTNFYSQFEIQQIKKGKWFILEDLHTGKRYKVFEKKGTEVIDSPGVIPGRIAKVDAHWYLVGSNSVYYPITYTQRHKKYVRSLKIKNYSPRDTVELLMSKENNNKAPFPPKLTKKQIVNMRKRIRKSYNKCVVKYNLGLSFEDLIKKVYEEDRVNVADFWVGLTKKGLSEDFVFEELQIIEDIWNYFPHRHLKDLSPIEAYAKMRNQQENI